VNLFSEYGDQAPSLPPPTAPEADPGESWAFGKGAKGVGSGGGLQFGSGRPRGKILVAVGLVLLLAVGAFAYLSLNRSTGGSALAMSFPPGQSFTYGLHMNMTGTLKIGAQSSPFTGNVSETLSWKVLSVGAHGVATVELKASGVSGSFNGQQVKSGTEFTTQIQVAPDGRVLVGGELTSSTSGSGFDVLGTDQFTPILPDHPVKPGDSWDKSFDQTLPFGGSQLRYTAHNTLDRYENVDGVKTAVIHSAMTIPLDISIDLRKLLETYGQGGSIPKALNPSIQYGGSVTVDETSWLDPQKGSLVKTLLDGRFDMQMQFKGFPVGQTPPGGQLTFTGNMTLALTRQF
jgi:hypothetical protein